jgi:hypothetical protein
MARKKRDHVKRDYVPRDYVPVDGDRVKRGLAASGLSQREAGRRVARALRGAEVKPADGESVAMTIRNIVCGQTRSCERVTRKALARTLDLPVRWLSGELEHLPHTFDVPVYIAERSASKGQAEYRQWKAGVAAQESAWRAVLSASATHADPGQQNPNRRQIAEYHFWKEVDPAFERLAASESEEAKRLALCLKWLVDPSWWRPRALRFGSNPTQSDTQETLPSHLRHDLESEEESEAREALMTAFRYILKPFMAQRAALDVAFFDRVTALQDVVRAEEEAVHRAEAAVRPQPPARKQKRSRR